MKIRQKLVFGFIAVAVMVLAVGAIGYCALIKTAQEYDEIVEVDSERIKQLTRAYGMYMEQVEDAIEYITKVESGENNKKEFFDEQKEYENAWNNYLGIREHKKIHGNMAKIGTALEQKVKPGYENFIEAAKQLFIAYESGKDIASMRSELKSFDEFSDVFEDVILELIQFNEKEIHVYHEKANNIRQIAVFTMITSSIAIVGLALIVGMLISRSIIKSLTKLKDAAIEIGEGKLNTRVEINTKDEIGILASAFDRMVDEIQKGTKNFRL